MKHFYTSKLVSLLLLLFIVSGSLAVNKYRSYKKILIEKFTGIHCGFCPEADIVASTILRAHPDSTYVISVHTGYYAEPLSGEPDFRYALGKILYDGNDGYPAGRLNRTIFENQPTPIISRSEWIKITKQLSMELADVNLEVKSSIDSLTRKLRVKVTAYYTGEDLKDTLFFHVALVENNIKGPQNGGNMGTNYIHNHVLRNFITGIYGDSIAIPIHGQTIEREYNYDIPAEYNRIKPKLQDMEVYVFATNGKNGEVLNTEGGLPDFVNFTAPLNATLSAISLPAQYAYNYFPAGIKNQSADTIKSLTFNVSVNSSTQTINVPVNIAPFAYKQIQINVNSYEVKENNTYTITLQGVNGLNIISSQTVSGSFSKPSTCSSKIILEFKPDNFGDENTIKIKDRNGNIEKVLGPYKPGYIAVYKDTVDLQTGEIHAVEINDKWGDGILSPRGYFKLRNIDGSLLAQNLQITDFGYTAFVLSQNSTGIDESIAPSSVLFIYQDEFSGKVTAVVKGLAAEEARITIYNIYGSVVSAKKININQNQSHTEDLNIEFPGIYIAELVCGKTKATRKFIIK
jgi:hypothetical protein